MPAYCLFCETQKCATIAHLIEYCLNIRCISPVIIQHKWVKGSVLEERHSMLPGYIFIYPREPLEKPLRIPGIIRILGNGELQNEDLAFASLLQEKDGVIGSICLDVDDGYYTINDSFWKKVEGKVMKIDKERKRCCIKFFFDSIYHTIWLGYYVNT